jgi:hypothetical protein
MRRSVFAVEDPRVRLSAMANVRLTSTKRPILRRRYRFGLDLDSRRDHVGHACDYQAWTLPALTHVPSGTWPRSTSIIG